MSDTAHAKTETQSPQSQLIQMATAHWISRFLYVAARMNLADQLAERSITEDSEHRFSLKRLGETLRTSTPGSVRASVLTLAGEIFTRAMDHLLYSVQTGKTGSEKALGVPLFDWLASHPAQASMFSETMVGLHGTSSRPSRPI